MMIHPFTWLKNISIARKLYFTVGIMAVLIAVELFALFFSINTLSSVRAYVGGEGLWSKAQKSAVSYLLSYGTSRDDRDFDRFKDYMKVPLGDGKARMEMEKENPDWARATEGLLEGRNHPEDVMGMLKLFRRFNKISYIKRAIVIWGEAEATVLKFIPIGNELHTEIHSPAPSQEKISALLAQIGPINDNLTVLEDNFSYTLGEGSRWLENLVLKILFSIALTVEISGLMLAFYLSRTIQKGLSEIISATTAFSKGNYFTRARIYSKDEIGILARAFNDMSEKLERAINAQVNSEQKVRKYNQELETKNKELEQFAYVASHDLQEPLNTVSGFVSLLEKRYKYKFDDNADKYLGYVVEASARMKRLIQVLLEYSRIDKDHFPEIVDCNEIFRQSKLDLKDIIHAREASVTAGPLPVLKGYPTGLSLLFQNLISNGIKFQAEGNRPLIHMEAKKTEEGWLFSIKDNGIGIKKEHNSKIFVIFQRLHLRSEFEGSGIGLAQCSKIISMHGGTIWVESELGKGSMFKFILNLP